MEVCQNADMGQYHLSEQKYHSLHIECAHLWHGWQKPTPWAAVFPRSPTPGMAAAANLEPSASPLLARISDSYEHGFAWSHCSRIPNKVTSP